MSGRRYTRHGIKRHRSYDTDEAARALGVAKGTVRRWIECGLPAMKEQRPYLILGDDLIQFLRDRIPTPQKLQLHECLCFTCRKPRAPAFRAVEYFPRTLTSGNLRALCEVCSGVMHKAMPPSRLDALRTLVDVSVRQG